MKHYGLIFNKNFKIIKNFKLNYSFNNNLRQYQ